MKIRGRRQLVGYGLLLVGILGLLLPHIAAATTTTPAGITVTPALLKVSVEKPTTPRIINVRNNSSTKADFAIELRSVRQARSGSLVPEDRLNTKLAEALSVSLNEFSLEPSQSADVEIVFNKPEALPPGGTYVSMLVTQRSGQGDAITVLPAVSALVFITKETGANPKLAVSNIVHDGSWLRAPSHVTASFKNTGNVALTPRAVAIVTDPRGNEVRRGALNQNAITILPDAATRVQTNLVSTGTAWLPGRYAMQVQYRHDGTDAYEIARLSTWYVPPSFWALLCLGAFVLALTWWSIRKLVHIVRRSKKPVAEPAAAKPKRPKKVFDIAPPPKTDKQ